MRKVFQLENLDCANCAAKIEQAISKISGVSKVSVSFMAQRLEIEAEGDIEDLMPLVKKEIARVEPDCEIVE